MSKQSEPRRTDRRTTTLLVLAAVLYWVWWDSFHEAGRFFLVPPFAPDSLGGTFGYVSCLMRSAGIVVGCLAIGRMLRRSPTFPLSRTLFKGLFVCEILLHVTYWAALPLPGTAAFVCALHAAISACATLNLMAIALVVNRLSLRGAAAAVLCCLGGYGVMNLAFSSVLEIAPQRAIGAACLLPLIGSFFLLAKFVNLEGLREERAHREVDVETPQPLILHLVVFGLTFGILHTLGGRIATGPLNINLPTFFASIIAVVVIAALFLSRNANFEIWSKMRSTVFPLTVIGVQLVPLVPNSDVALSVMESGALLYDAVFAVGCIALMRRTFVDPCLIVARGLLYKNLGTAFGILWTAFFYFKVASFSIDEQIMLAVIVTLLLTIATFWVGSDERIRKIWGLRKKLSPKQYNDALVKLKCETLSSEFNLTARESETLLLLAQGRRASEIKEEKHLSINTVRSHIQRVYTKLDVHSVDSLNDLLRRTEVDEKEIR